MKNIHAVAPAVQATRRELACAPKACKRKHSSASLDHDNEIMFVLYLAAMDSCFARLAVSSAAAGANRVNDFRITS